MDHLIKLVAAYQKKTGLARRMELAQEICRMIALDLRFFVFGAVQPPDAEDIFQNTVRDIYRGMGKFQGDTSKQFWAWCYRIARNNISNHYREKGADRLLPMPHEDLAELLDLSAQDAPMSAEVRHDLEYVLNLLTRSKPECYEFLWQHYVFGLDYAEIAKERIMTYDSVRMKIGRCLDEARKLVS